MQPPRNKLVALGALSLVGIGTLLFYEKEQETRLRELRRAIQALRVQDQSLASAAPNGAAASLIREITARKTRPENAASSFRDIQSGLTPIGSLNYVGQATPLAAVESSLWAIYHGDVDKLATMIALTPDGAKAAASLFANLPEDTKARLQTSENMMALLVAYAYNAVGYQVLESNQKGDDRGTWTVQAVVQLEDGRTSRPNVTLQTSNGNWQVQFDENAVRQFATVLGVTDPLNSAGRLGSR
jgi:hypothetical protein